MMIFYPPSPPGSVTISSRIMNDSLNLDNIYGTYETDRELPGDRGTDARLICDLCNLAEKLSGQIARLQLELEAAQKKSQISP